MGKLELGDYGPLFITCLHLDHRTEPKRIRELKEIIRKSYEPRKEAGHIWAGDFNSLTREDYTIKEWNEIARVRSLNCWEKPRVELTDLVKKQDFQDTWQLCPDKPTLVKTCRFDTHIDYIYTNSKFSSKFRVSNVSNEDDSASDHNMIITTFDVKKQ